jgi:hypothetical protein
MGSFSKAIAPSGSLRSPAPPDRFAGGAGNLYRGRTADIVFGTFMFSSSRNSQGALYAAWRDDKLWQ